jgi:hypothetical protein
MSVRLSREQTPQRGFPDGRAEGQHAQAFLTGGYRTGVEQEAVLGQTGTPFSNCVSRGAKLLKDKHKSP